MSVGSPAIYTFFFNKETAEVSPTYFNPFIVENKYIAYIDYDKGGVLDLLICFKEVRFI